MAEGEPEHREAERALGRGSRREALRRGQQHRKIAPLRECGKAGEAPRHQIAPATATPTPGTRSACSQRCITSASTPTSAT